MHISIKLDYDSVNKDRVYELEWIDSDDKPEYVKFLHKPNFSHMSEKNIINKLIEHAEKSIGVVTSCDVIHTGEYSLYMLSNTSSNLPYGI